MSTRRASAFESDDIDLSGFAPKTSHDKGAPLDAIKAIAQQSKFQERDGPASAGQGTRPPRQGADAGAAHHRRARHRQIA